MTTKTKATGATRRAALVAIEAIEAHPTNIRRDLGDLRALTESIRQDGILVPLIVERRGVMLRVRDGHRRLAAARMAGLQHVPVFIWSEALELDEWVRQAVVVNNQRRDQLASERRESIVRLRALGMSWAAIADAYGVSAKTVRAWAGNDTGRPVGRRGAAGAKNLPIPRRRLRAFVDDWRARETAPAVEVLDALDQLILGQEPNPDDDAEDNQDDAEVAPYRWTTTPVDERVHPDTCGRPTVGRRAHTRHDTPLCDDCRKADNEYSTHRRNVRADQQGETPR